MLWKKESHQHSALYIDITVPITIQECSKPHQEKSNTISLEKRNKGNEKFRDSALLEAMEFYNDSLRVAKPGSEQISLAFANRSACFLQLKMYDECLTDIELAKEAGYPEHLLPKLEELKARCLKESQEDPQHPHEQLSIVANKKYPYLSNVAKIQRNGSKDDYSVVAKIDIDVGQPIIIEDAYRAYVAHSFGVFCNICAKQFCNLVPCNKCAVAMFCSNCQGHFLHKYECGLNFCNELEFNSGVMRLVRSILFAVKLFPSVDELMVFVERMLKHPNRLPDSMLDDRSKYQVHFNNPLKGAIKSLEVINEKLSAVYKTLLRIPHVREMFKTTKHRRFLMHLIGHHMTIPGITSGILIRHLETPSGPPACVSPLMPNYFKHSCDPNVFVTTNGGTHIIAFSLKPIKKGEQLFISSAPEGMNSKKERKKFLMDMLKIKCECLRCQGKTASPAQRQQLASDPAFRFIEANVVSLRPLLFNSKHMEPLMHAFFEVLRKYGRMHCCDELDFIFAWFKFLYNNRSVGGGADFNNPLAREFLS